MGGSLSPIPGSVEQAAVWAGCQIVIGHACITTYYGQFNCLFLDRTNTISRGHTCMEKTWKVPTNKTGGGGNQSPKPVEVRPPNRYQTHVSCSHSAAMIYMCQSLVISSSNNIKIRSSSVYNYLLCNTGSAQVHVRMSLM